MQRHSCERSREPIANLRGAITRAEPIAAVLDVRDGRD
jgi:hypothetical protein